MLESRTFCTQFKESNKCYFREWRKEINIFTELRAFSAGTYLHNLHFSPPVLSVHVGQFAAGEAHLCWAGINWKIVIVQSLNLAYTALKSCTTILP